VTDFSRLPEGHGRLNSGMTAIVSGTLAFQETWALDQTGNWGSYMQNATGGGTPSLVQLRDANRANEITEVANTTGPGWIVPKYDLAGNMRKLPQPPNPSSGYEATWDAWNRLVQLTDGDTIIAQFAYDGLMRRVSAVYPSEARHFYYSSAWQILEERPGTSPDTATPDRQFVWGMRYIDELILRDRSVTGTLDERLYAMQDANWNITAICDTSGDIQERYAYSAYGVVQFLDPDFNPVTSSDFGWETLYCGYRFVTAAGLYFVRNRSLNPPLGNWLSRDPIAFYSSSNLYLYGAASPVGSVDPLGTVCSTDRRNFAMTDPNLNQGEPPKSVATIDAYLIVGPECTGTKQDYRVNIDVDAYSQIPNPLPGNLQTGLPGGFGPPLAGCNDVTAQRLNGVATAGGIFTLLVSQTPDCKLSFGLYPAPAGRGGCAVLYINLDCAIPCQPNQCCADAHGRFTFGVQQERGPNRTIAVNWWIAVGESSNCELETCHSGISILQY
jgi:RHS repeat-associated protein